MRTAKRFLSPRVLRGRPRQRAGRALSFHTIIEVKMKSPYYQAIDTNIGKILVIVPHLENLLAVFDYALPSHIDVYEIRQKKIM